MILSLFRRIASSISVRFFSTGLGHPADLIAHDVGFVLPLFSAFPCVFDGINDTMITTLRKQNKDKMTFRPDKFTRKPLSFGCPSFFLSVVEVFLSFHFLFFLLFRRFFGKKRTYLLLFRTNLLIFRAAALRFFVRICVFVRDVRISIFRWHT